MKKYRLLRMRLRVSPERVPHWRIQARELEVLYAVRDGLVYRDLLFGDLAPWMLGTRDVSWSITLLVFHGMVRLGAFGFGPPEISPQGLLMLDPCVDLHALGDQL